MWWRPRPSVPIVGAVLLLGGLVATMATGCSSYRAGAPPSTSVRPTAILVGDSLAVLGAEPITGEIEAAGWQVTIDAYPGVTTAEQMSALEKAADTPALAVVIELGTNDAHHLVSGELDPGTEGADIAKALDLFGSRCVVWVNVDSDPSRPGGTGGAIVNDALEAEAANRPNMRVVDFDRVLASDSSLLLDDQVHLTRDGSTALGKLIAHQLDECR